jgi:RNA polymerase sigma-70 factor (ECF subfamily)
MWVRYLAGRHLGRIHRDHLARQMRNPAREVSLTYGGVPDAPSAALAAQLLCKGSRPSELAMRAERKRRLQWALDRIDPIDREVLSLRRFVYLTRAETAQVLNFTQAAVAKCYLRALDRLPEILAGGLGARRRSIPRDDLGSAMGPEPRRYGVRFTVREKVDHTTALEIDQDRAV